MVLKYFFIAFQVLLTPALRDFIAEDGHQATEEHCRVCHRLGEMLVCDTCPGVYHLGCLDPPMHDVPEEEWRCYVCVANDVEGVNECPAQPVGKKGQGSCRQDALGFDRGGNKYWFIARKLIIEMADGKEVSYCMQTEMGLIYKLNQSELTLFLLLTNVSFRRCTIPPCGN